MTLVVIMVPYEDYIDAAQARKQFHCYVDLLEECENADWKAKYFPNETGCRELTGHVLSKVSLLLGLTHRKVNDRYTNYGRKGLDLFK